MAQLRFHVGKPAAQMVGTIQHHIDGRGIEGPFETAGAVQQPFGFLSQHLNVPQFQESGQTLDGVETAENGI